MPYEYLPDIAIADVAFRAKGKTVEGLFAAAAEATTNVMVDDLSTIRDAEEIHIDLSENALDMLLFDFLNELIYLKDVKQLLLFPKELRVSTDGSRHRLLATLY
jgi:SHS2 domain-containing protein